MKKFGFKGKGGQRKGGGGVNKKSCKFCSEGICNDANSLPECQKPAFLTFSKFEFSRGSMSPDPKLYYA